MSDDIETPDEEPAFDRAFPAPSEQVERLSPLVRRIVADNAGPFTFTGTCTYLIGNGAVAVLDPGPASEAHVDRILAALAGEKVDQILVTHTHRDHSPGAAMLRAATGAPIFGCAPYAPAPTEAAQGLPALDAAHDRDYAPDRVLADGEDVVGEGFVLTSVATPGHAANHLAFALEAEHALFSGDHVMAWSTSVVAPPDGKMGDYMASLARLVPRQDAIYWPGHGGPVRQPQRFVRALIQHRRQREANILARVADGVSDIPTLVTRLYDGLAPALRGAAALTVLAHLEDLLARGLVTCDGPPSPKARFRPA